MAHTDFKKPQEYIERALSTVALLIDAQSNDYPSDGGEMDKDVHNGKGWALDLTYSDLKKASQLLQEPSDKKDLTLVK